MRVEQHVQEKPVADAGGPTGVADANPISRLVTAERGLMEGTATVAQVLWVLAAAAVLTALFAPLTTWLYRRRG